MDLKINNKNVILGLFSKPKKGTKIGLTGKFRKAYLKSSCLQGAPEMARDGPKMTQNQPKIAQDGLKIAQDGPKMTQDGPKMA